MPSLNTGNRELCTSLLKLCRGKLGIRHSKACGARDFFQRTRSTFIHIFISLSIFIPESANRGGQIEDALKNDNMTANL